MANIFNSTYRHAGIIEGGLGQGKPLNKRHRRTPRPKSTPSGEVCRISANAGRLLHAFNHRTADAWPANLRGIAKYESLFDRCHPADAFLAWFFCFDNAFRWNRFLDQCRILYSVSLHLRLAFAGRHRNTYRKIAKSNQWRLVKYKMRP